MHCFACLCSRLGILVHVFIAIFIFFRGLSAPEAEMLYMQEVEKIEGYGQESYQAKVSL